MSQLNDLLSKITLAHPLIIPLIIAIAAFTAFVSIKFLGPNNAVEQVAEEVLEAEGVHINMPGTSAIKS